VRQPVMCQHCDNAPCENVCPVAATNHSDEGINQMAYNRCIGTRYCNNNCPYKVRRFNWFDYNKADSIKNNTIDPAGLSLDLPRMVLNPDVTVRAKGVIEKCSFCIQRIQEKKLDAKLENRGLKDGEVIPACGQACPSDAIIFGDMNDENSKISKHFKDERNYHLLEELYTLPSVGYLTKVRNKEPENTQTETHAHGASHR
jgi:Fe-S-cluster-containing dehydrogenase component